MSQASCRVDTVQALIDSLRATNYLEIGVQSGDTYFWIKARKKMAVDPRFLFSAWDKLRWMRWNSYNVFNEYYPVASDTFFSKKSGLLKRRGLDVVFVDGLHTFEQSLSDIENALRFLRGDGVIVVDDCDPPNEPASRPIKPAGNDPWCGDVWKSIAYLRSARRDLNVFVLDCAYGLGIVTRGSPENMLEYDPSGIKSMSYMDFAANREAILNIKNPDYLREFLAARPGA